MQKRNIITTVVCFLAFVGISLLIYKLWKENFDLKRFTIWLENHGLMARFVYAAAVALQIVIAVIPAGPLQLAGGYAFGTLESTAFYLIGSLLGSLTVFLLVRYVGKHVAELFVSKESMGKFEPMLQSKKGMTIFSIIFMIPGSPKDVLCYVAGFSTMKISTFLLISMVGRVPALIGTSLTASCLGKEKYEIAIIAAILTILFCLAGALVYKRLMKRHKAISMEMN